MERPSLDVNVVRLGVSVSFVTLRRPEMRLRYGMNPQQAAACATPVMPDNWPVRVAHGQPSLINMMDALGAWQLVREAAAAGQARRRVLQAHVPRRHSRGGSRR